MSRDNRRTATGERRRRDRHAVMLAVFSGASDAFGYFGLGGSFTSVMTGNLVLLGIAAAGRKSALAVHALAAIVGYVAGTVAGARIAGKPEPTDPVWPASVTVALAVEFALFLATGIVWFVTGAAPTAALQLALLGASAAGLGIQSAAIGRFGESGLSTTYLTGTLTTLVTGLATGRSISAMRRSAFILLGLVAGASAGTLLLTYVRPLAPMVSLVLLATVVLRANTRSSRRGERGAVDASAASGAAERRPRSSRGIHRGQPGRQERQEGVEPVGRLPRCGPER